jgi:ABC-type proline/glycine betaine transport system substrate-binding protein
MRKILETEDYVPVPPMVTEDLFYRMTYIMKQEIRKHKWIEGEKGRPLTWEEASKEWIENHQSAFEKFFNETLRH